VSWSDVLLILGGLGAGFLSGTIGIGGGLLFVPTMTIGFGLSQAVAQGTSLVAIIPTAIVGGVTHLRQGHVLLRPLVAVEVPGPILARFWGAFLVFSAYRLGLQAFKASPKTA